MQNDLESSSLRNCRVQNVSTDVIPETELMLQKETQVKRADRKVYLHLYLVWHIHIYIYTDCRHRDKYKCGGEQKKKGRQTKRLIAS